MISDHAVNNHPNTPNNAAIYNFREVRKGTSVIAFFLGMAIVAESILLGRSYALYISFLAFSILITLLWTKAPLPWIFLVSVVAATPIPMFRQQLAPNLIFAVWFVAFNMRYLSKLPKWVYVPLGLATIGVVTSSINWLSGDIIHSILRQSAFFLNFGLAPCILLPIIYFRMEKSRDSGANLKGLLFCLILPSTLILLAAKVLGTQAYVWEASLHVESLAEGYLYYQLGRVVVGFGRTGVGFILAALICASTAVTASRIKTLYKLLAGACLIPNAFFLLTTGSHGSIFACLCGLAAIFYALGRSVNIARVLVSVILITCMFFLIYTLSPLSVKEYLEKRYEQRVAAGMKQDRFVLWGFALNYFLQHPEGVGLTFNVGDKEKINPHSDYLAYAVSYGVTGGLAYAYLVGKLIVYFFRRRKSRIEDSSAFAVYLAGLGVIVAFAVNSMTDNIAVNRWYFNVIWSLIWYCYFCSRAPQTKTVPKRGSVEGEAMERMEQSSGVLITI